MFAYTEKCTHQCASKPWPGRDRSRRRSWPAASLHHSLLHPPLANSSAPCFHVARPPLAQPIMILIISVVLLRSHTFGAAARWRITPSHGDWEETQRAKRTNRYTHTLQQADTLLHTQKCIDLDAARRPQVSDHDTMRHAPIVRWCLLAPALLQPCRDADVWCKRIVSGHSCLRSLGGCVIGGGYRNSVYCCGLAAVVHSDGKDSLVGFLLLLFCFMMIICRCTYKMFCMALFSVNVPAECSTIRFAMAEHKKKGRCESPRTVVKVIAVRGAWLPGVWRWAAASGQFFITLYYVSFKALFQFRLVCNGWCNAIKVCELISSGVNVFLVD